METNREKPKTKSSTQESTKFCMCILLCLNSPSSIPDLMDRPSLHPTVTFQFGLYLSIGRSPPRTIIKRYCKSKRPKLFDKMKMLLLLLAFTITNVASQITSSPTPGNVEKTLSPTITVTRMPTDDTVITLSPTVADDDDIVVTLQPTVGGVDDIVITLQPTEDTMDDDTVVTTLQPSTSLPTEGTNVPEMVSSRSCFRSISNKTCTMNNKLYFEYLYVSLPSCFSLYHIIMCNNLETNCKTHQETDW